MKCFLKYYFHGGWKWDKKMEKGLWQLLDRKKSGRHNCMFLANLFLVSVFLIFLSLLLFILRILLYWKFLIKTLNTNLTSWFKAIFIFLTILFIWSTAIFLDAIFLLLPNSTWTTLTKAWNLWYLSWTAYKSGDFQAVVLRLITFSCLFTQARVVAEEWKENRINN